MLSEIDLRNAIVEDPEGVKYLLLSSHAARLVKWIIKNGSITARELSDGAEISLQNASAQLSRLYSRGYLKRKEYLSQSGGIEYIYKSAI